MGLLNSLITFYILCRLSTVSMHYFHFFNDNRIFNKAIGALPPWHVREGSGSGRGLPLGRGIFYHWHCLELSALAAIKTKPTVSQLFTILELLLFKWCKSLHAWQLLPLSRPLLGAGLWLPNRLERKKEGSCLNLSIGYLRITWNQYSIPVSTVKGIWQHDPTSPWWSHFRGGVAPFSLWRLLCSAWNPEGASWVPPHGNFTRESWGWLRGITLHLYPGGPGNEIPYHMKGSPHRHPVNLL